MRKKIIFTEPSMTIQSEAAQTDINYIIDRARVTGAWSSRNKKEPIYIDCSTVGDFQSSLERVRTTEKAFNQLPAAVRDRFGNNPVKMVDFLLDPKNRPEAEQLGLLKPKNEQGNPGSKPSVEPPSQPK